MSGKSRKFIKNITKPYRLSVTDENNFTEVFSKRISKLKVWSAVLLIFCLSAVFVIVLLFYTPLKQSVPGYPSSKMRKMMIYNAVMLDSLENELARRDKFLDQIKRVIQGEIIEDFVEEIEPIYIVSMEPMNNDSIFNELIGPDKYKFTYVSTNEDFVEMSRLNFFTPVKGVVVNKFNASPGHYGTDIVGKENSHISAVLDGTVVFAEWSVSTGYVVQIQHDFNLISIYKHNSDVLVKSGDFVKAGGVIAIMGNEGELTTGPHLHFELWQNGVPLNPEQYINF